LMSEVQKTWQIARVPIREEIEPLKIALMTSAGHPLTPAADALAMCIRRRVTSM
jgi:LysR family transcriptional regulator of abg operon